MLIMHTKVTVYGANACLPRITDPTPRASHCADARPTWSSQRRASSTSANCSLASEHIKHMLCQCGGGEILAKIWKTTVIKKEKRFGHNNALNNKIYPCVLLERELMLASILYVSAHVHTFAHYICTSINKLFQGEKKNGNRPRHGR